MSSQELKKLSQADITTLDPKSLAKADTISLDTALPQAERIELFLDQVNNPYCFISGDTPVKIRFVGGDKPLSQSLLSYFSRLKQK